MIRKSAKLGAVKLKRHSIASSTQSKEPDEIVKIVKPKSLRKQPSQKASPRQIEVQIPAPRDNFKIFKQKRGKINYEFNLFKDSVAKVEEPYVIN